MQQIAFTPTFWQMCHYSEYLNAILPNDYTLVFALLLVEQDILIFYLRGTLLTVTNNS